MRKDGFVICTTDYYLDEDCYWVTMKTTKNPHVFSRREVLNLMTQAWDEDWGRKPTHYINAFREGDKTIMNSTKIGINLV